MEHLSEKVAAGRLHTLLRGFRKAMNNKPTRPPYWTERPFSSLPAGVTAVPTTAPDAPDVVEGEIVEDGNEIAVSNWRSEADFD